ncbi:MAG: hypothetical protein H0W00_00085 [Chloroflexi bacterium]|jgi:hypothetical protein|nr:hypothetical protein [Chloroflexota bacterium]
MDEPSLVDPLYCSVCGQPLLGDPDDQPDPPLGPMCGESYRAREFDQTLWELEMFEDH